MSELWFIIYAESDNSHSVVPECSVLNASDVSVGDFVTFFYNHKSHIGKVVMKNTDFQFWNAQVKKLGSTTKRTIKPKDMDVHGKRTVKPPNHFTYDIKPDAETQKAKKRKGKSAAARKIKEAGELEMNRKVLAMDENDENKMHDVNDDFQGDDKSSDDDEQLYDSKKRKASRTQLLKVIKNPLSDSEDDIPEEKKEETDSVDYLKKVLAETQAKLKALEAEKQPSNDKPSTSRQSRSGSGFGSDDAMCSEGNLKVPKIALTSNKESVSPKHDVNDSGDSDATEIIEGNDDGNGLEPAYVEQLHGKLCGEEMFNLGKNIYCKVKVLNEANDKSHNPTHMVRRLMTGVFKDEAFLISTLTGQAPRAAGKEHYKAGDEIPPLYPKAIDAIIDYAMGLCKNNKWPVPPRQTLRDAMTQRVGEVKRKLKRQALEAGAAGGKAGAAGGAAHIGDANGNGAH